MLTYCPHCRGFVTAEINEREIGEITEREICCNKCHKTIRKYIYKKEEKNDRDSGVD